MDIRDVQEGHSHSFIMEMQNGIYTFEDYLILSLKPINTLVIQYCNDALGISSELQKPNDSSWPNSKLPKLQHIEECPSMQIHKNLLV